MRMSQFFLPLLKEAPAEASIVSHQYMLRAGMIRQLASGLYTWLPLGLRVLENLVRVIDEEMQASGAQKLLMSCIQPASLWEESGRADGYGKETLRMEDRHGNLLFFSPTNEEVITHLAKQSFKSYRDLPKNLYQIQWKFRDEIRPRFGVMRGREFYMKDSYSFAMDLDTATLQYRDMLRTYMRIFARMGLKAIPIRADTGPIGGDLSHEFHIMAHTGESQIYYDTAFAEVDVDNLDVDALLSLYSAADEMHDPATCPLPEGQLHTSRGIEVGHIFLIGTKYSAAMGLRVPDQQGALVTPQMGCYGIGVSRLVGAIIEASHDARGIIWPMSVAPFQVSLLNLRPGDAECDAAAEALYAALQAAGVSTLYDDSSETTGSKFATHELIGIPLQAIVSPRNLKEGKIELKERADGTVTTVSLENAATVICEMRNAKL